LVLDCRFHRGFGQHGGAMMLAVCVRPLQPQPSAAILGIVPSRNLLQ
jgi:hypothetical protein